MRNAFVSFAVSDMMVDALHRAAEMNDANLAYSLLRKICVVEDLTLPNPRKLNKTAQTILDLASQDQARFRERIDEREEKRRQWRDEKANKKARLSAECAESSNGILAEFPQEGLAEVQRNSVSSNSNSNSTSREKGISAEIPDSLSQTSLTQEEEVGWWDYYRAHWTHWGSTETAKLVWHRLWVAGELPPMKELLATMREQGKEFGWCANPSPRVHVPNCLEYLQAKMWMIKNEKKPAAPAQVKVTSLEDL